MTHHSDTEISELIERLNALHSDPIGCGLVRQWYVNPDGPEAAAALQSLLADKARMEWQPIETFAEPTAPSSGNGVLVADADGTVGEAYFRNYGDDDEGWWWANTNWGDYPEPDRPNKPTHWLPLPEPPGTITPKEEE